MWEILMEGEQVKNYFDSEAGSIRYIFAPFIQKKTFENVVPESGLDTIIITRWRVADLAAGVSDPEVFEVCRKHGYSLKIHSKLHAKVYSWDLDDALVGSANVTAAGMGLNESPNAEVLIGPIQLPIAIQIKLRKVEKQARLVGLEDYEKAIEIRDKAGGEIPNYDEVQIGRDPEFLTSQLPMTDEPDLLINLLSADHPQSFDDLPHEVLRCVLHDIATYNLDKSRNASVEQVRAELRSSFLQDPFIHMIVENMDPCIYFGEMKALVQDQCEDVPRPSRYELTDNVKLLYRWFPLIAPERFQHDVPGAHSERLCDQSRNPS